MPRIWHPVLSSISRLYKRLSIDPVARSMSMSSINRLPLILNIPLCVVKAVLKRLCKELTHDVAAGGKRSSTELWYLPFPVEQERAAGESFVACWAIQSYIEGEQRFAVFETIVSAWISYASKRLCCLPDCVAWLSMLLDSLFAWLTLLLEPLCCLTHCAAWRIILLDSLCCLTHWGWLIVLLDSACFLTHCVSWRIVFQVLLFCFTQGVAWLRVPLTHWGWLTVLLDWLCCLADCAPSFVMLLDPLCCLTHCVTWLTVMLDSLCCWTHCFALRIVLLDSLWLTDCAAWLTVLPDSPFCLTHCVSWLTALLGSLCYLTHSVAGLIVLLDSLWLTDSNEANMAIRGLDGWSKQRSRLGIDVTYWRGWFSARRDTSIISVDYLMVSFPPCLVGTTITVTFTR